MTDSEFKEYLELGSLINRIEAHADNIKKGDLNCQLVYLEKDPYFDMRSSATELRNNALREYYEMLISAFTSSCRYYYQRSDNTFLEAVNACLEDLNRILTLRDFEIQLIPMAKTVKEMYESALKKLKEAGAKESIQLLEELRRRIFLSWQSVSY